MTRRQWTTPEQADWLKERLAAFVDSQANRTTMKEFFPQILKDWRILWPLAQPTADEIAKANNVEDAVKNKKIKDDERIKAWFHNHTRGSTSGTGTHGLPPVTHGLLKITGQSRLRQEWQVYQSMTYENKWKEVIDSEWDEYQKKWKLDHPNTNLPQKRFAFMNSFLKEKYKEEAEEVKKEVRERRAAMKAEIDEKDNRNDAYQR
ncbi:hypothetical protein K443DRAFT_116087 [Laccaria amethystina LaAM-08-1]|uniref:Uncharacterized protein n=1 Tax=Laccaria amethystina LaAM-08-1 TaxID=1095629 RepID=A0A0C9WZP5_9AGAR|nr:hypothetical protein K443DRAFT_116087 [Laccaria amethystina LaAM-08-1]